SGIPIGPLTQSVASSVLGIADPVVSKLISPEALSELLSAGWPVTVVPDPPPGTVGVTRSTIGTVRQIFGNSEYGLGRFEVSAPAALPPQQRFVLTFRLLQWRWRLVGVTLPENIQNLLGDELIKRMKAPMTPLNRASNSVGAWRARRDFAGTRRARRQPPYP